MEPDKPAFNPIQEAIDILMAMRTKIADNANLLWTSYDSPDQIREGLDKYIDGLRNFDSKYINRLGVFFYPTSDFQVMAIDNGWGDDYLKLADRYDQISLEVGKLQHGNQLSPMRKPSLDV